MKVSHIIYFLVLVISSLALWPQPRQYTHGDTVLWLSPSVQFKYQPAELENEGPVLTFVPGFLIPHEWLEWARFLGLKVNQEPHDPASCVHEIILKAIKRTQRDMLRSKFVPWKSHPRNHTFEPSRDVNSPNITEVVIKEIARSQLSSTRDYLNEDESYEVEVSELGNVTISTESSIGTLRALQTFSQLFYASSSKQGVYTPLAPIFITDTPKWNHRGLNLDVSRNVFRPKDVKRTIDAMSSVKMNRLHVHVTDSQSWPLDIPSMPSLAEKGAYHRSQIWSSSDLKDVQVYGFERGVSVFLEIDLPGHTASVGHAYPDLVAAFHMEKWETYAVEPPSGQLKLNSSAVGDFLDLLMADLLPRVAPWTEYFHTGGDEFNLNTYLLERNLGSRDQKVLKPMLQNMIRRVHAAIQEAGMTPIVWEEMVLDWNLDIPSTTKGRAGKHDDVIVQAWRNSSVIEQLLQRGYRTIFGSADAWYLDCGLGNFLNPRHPGPSTVRDPYLDWCPPQKNWRRIYTYNPLKDIPKKLQRLIIGGEAHMWTEQVDPVNMDQAIWPRAAAAAEVLWTGPRDAGQIQEASYRLGEWRERAVIDTGVAAGMTQMTYCLMRESGCEA